MALGGSCLIGSRWWGPRRRHAGVQAAAVANDLAEITTAIRNTA